MVSRGINFQPINYWEEYVPGPSKIETDACQEWVLSRPGVVKMIEHINGEVGLERDWWILDAGCKEGWTGEYLINEWDCDRTRQVGLELSGEQVNYAHIMGRSWVQIGNVCDMNLYGNNLFDLVLNRHVLGLTQDAFQAMEEMWRVLKPGGLLYVITHIPGNVKKHYSYISNKGIIDEWLKEMVFQPHTKIHYGWNPKFNEHQDNRRKELVIFLRKEKKMINVWGLIRETFKDGDDVIVVTDEDKFEWGKIKMHDSVCVLIKPKGDVSLNWNDIRFISHDGLPVKKLIGADGSALIESLDTTDTQEIIRKVMAIPEYTPPIRRRTIFGDPFMIENFTGELLNKGNIWPPHLDKWDTTFEETILLKHKGGATGLLWNLDTCYYFE